MTLQSDTVIDFSPNEIDPEADAPGIPLTVGESMLALLRSSTMLNVQPSLSTYGVALPSELGKLVDCSAQANSRDRAMATRSVEVFTLRRSGISDVSRVLTWQRSGDRSR